VFAVTAARTNGFLCRKWGEVGDRDDFIGLKVKDNGLIGPFKERGDPVFSVYVALTVVFGFRLHDRATSAAARVGKHEGVRWDATPRTAGRANDFDF
jgi:hypothetical protein